MKEATGEFSMTVVTILAVIVIAALVTWLGPRITNYIQSVWNNTIECPAGTTYNAATGACA